MKQERTLKQISITLDNVTAQCVVIDDFIHDVCKEHPEYNTYHKLFDYIWGSLYDIQEKLKTL